MKLQWQLEEDRHGLGKLVHCVNHVALIVSDVGRSTVFYTDVLGFQQIKRPNFDRHGAWLTCGNVEVHLIKGIPLVHEGESLNVSHLSVGVTDPALAMKRLEEMGIPFKLDISVPLGGVGSSDNTPSQAFIQDPDGYFVKICGSQFLSDIVKPKLVDLQEGARTILETSIAVNTEATEQNAATFSTKEIMAATLALKIADGEKASEMGHFKHIAVSEHDDVLEEFPLHWDPSIERRGLGNLVTSMNHFSLTVSDVEHSLEFYTEVLGLQQIKHPSLDHDSAWLTAGNMEIHLVKGEPLVHSGENLIVCHVAVDVIDPALAFKRLQDMEVSFEVNVSVPKGSGKAESEGGSAGNTLSQAFFRDPDGYYFEVCNCNLLTDFVLGSGGHETDHLVDYEEGGIHVLHEDSVPKYKAIGFQSVKITLAAERAKKTYGDLVLGRHKDVLPLPVHEQPKECNALYLENLKKRREVYGDICQSFDDAQLKEILKESGNHPPTAILLMEHRIWSGQHKRVFRPPGYYVHGRRANHQKFTPSAFDSALPPAIVNGET